MPNLRREKTGNGAAYGLGSERFRFGQSKLGTAEYAEVWAENADNLRGDAKMKDYMAFAQQPAGVTQVRMYTGRSPVERWLSVACVLLVLFASVGQASHFCGLPSGSAGSAAEMQALSASNTLCLTCLMTQSAAVAPLGFMVFAALRPVGNLPIPVACSESFQPSFHLYVRPPPVA